MVGTAFYKFHRGKDICRKLTLLLHLHGGACYLQRIRVQRCVSFSHQRFFKPTYSFWGMGVHLETSFVRRNELMVGGLRSGMEVGRCLPVMPVNPQEPYLGLFLCCCKYAISWGFSRSTCGGSTMSFLTCQPDFTEFLKNSPLREVHGCLDIWDRKHLPCNLYVKDSWRGRKLADPFVSMWTLGMMLKRNLLNEERTTRNAEAGGGGVKNENVPS